MSRPAAPYRLLGFDVSYFTAKVRPALRYKRVWYDEERADLREIGARTGLHYIPVVVTPEDETWQDSTLIYDRLEERHPNPPLFPSTPVQRLAAHLIELYVDEFALLPAMHYRWGSELAVTTTRARFVAILGDEKLGQGAAKSMAQARLMLGANDETGPLIEEHTQELFMALSRHFEAHSYLLGERMSFADCALMGPFYAHLWGDLVSRRLLLETAPPVVGWIERCNFPRGDRQGEWLADDALAPTLESVLAAMGRDATPMILDLVRVVEDWADAHTDASGDLPRAVGACQTTLRGQSVTRAAMVYTLFSLQRVVDTYRALGEKDQRRVDRALAGSGFEPILAYQPRHRIRHEGFQLRLERA